ncbi:MAG TPA: hypothetical protein VN811_12415, partial [Thermoanaerobaculia bacterium]|nr:hypothetical protein [Thermoanaerobaculia bacterium]
VMAAGAAQEAEGAEETEGAAEEATVAAGRRLAAARRAPVPGLAPPQGLAGPVPVTAAGTAVSARLAPRRTEPVPLAVLVRTPAPRPEPRRELVPRPALVAPQELELQQEAAPEARAAATEEVATVAE